MSMAIKLDRMVTYHEGFPPIMLYDSSILWPCEFKRRIKCAVFIYTRPMDTKHSKVVI